MVGHMLWILTSDKFVELTLDGINILYGHLTLLLVLSHKLIEEFNDPHL
jgi:hypothetical protein